MKIVAFDLRAAGQSSYHHAIIDLAAVVMEDGELIDTFHGYLGINDWLSYRPAIMRDSHVSFKSLQAAEPYHDVVGDFVAWLDEARGPLPVWGFEAKEKAAFVVSSLKYSKLPVAFDRIADVSMLFASMTAIGAAAPAPSSFEHVLHRLELELPSPRVDALERAKLTATAVAMLEDELRRFYTMPALEIVAAGPAAPPSFDPFDESEPPALTDGYDDKDPDRYRKAFFATLGEKGLPYEGTDAKAAVRAFLAESPLWTGGKVTTASAVTPEVFAERLAVLKRWADGEIPIPVFDAYLRQQGSLL